MLSLRSLLVRALGDNKPGFRKSTDLEGKVYVLDFTASKARIKNDAFNAAPVVERRKAAGYRGF